MSKLYRYIYLTLLVLFAFVQEVQAENFWRWTKNLLDSSDIKGCDTTYVRMSKKGFVAYLMSSPSWASTNFYVHDPDGDIEMSLSSRVTNMWALRLAYRGWGLSYSHAFKNRDDSEFSFTAYGRRYGFEFRIHSSHDLNGGITDHTVYPVMSGDIDGIYDMKTWLLNFYWVFNSKRFSLPAAMSQTTIQRRSAGSWLACANYVYNKLFYQSDMELEPEEMTAASFKQINIGGGYAYNFAFAKEHCLLHASAMPMLSVWHQNRIRTVGGLDYPVSQQMITLSLMAHLSFVYNFDRYVTGCSSMYNLSHLHSHKDDLYIYVNNFSTTIFFGVRF